jgi:PAS domain S-box-containing protein
MAKWHKQTSEIDWDELKDRLHRQAELYGLQTGTSSLQLQWLRLFSFFQDSTEGMLLLDESGQVLMANRAGQQLFGKSQAELLECTVFDLLPLKEEVAREPLTWLKAAASMGLYNTGDSVRNRRSFAIRQLKVEEMDERIAIQVYIREVTELVRQTEFESDQLAMLLQMLSHSREPFILLDASLTLFEFNDAANRMMYAITGRYMKKGLSFLDYATPGRAKEKGWQIFREVLSGLVVEREIQLPSPLGGSTNTWLLTYQPLYDAYGEMAGVFISGTDQTLERGWQHLLAEQGERLAAWEQGHDSALCLLDGNFKIRYVGGGLAEWLGMEGKRLEGSSIRKYLVNKDQLTEWVANRETEPGRPFTAIWEMANVHNKRFRIKVQARLDPATDGKGLLGLHMQRTDDLDLIRQLELAYEILSAGSFGDSVKYFVLFGRDGQALLQGLQPFVEMRDLVDLNGVLRFLGKQPKTVMRQWDEVMRAPMRFKSKFRTDVDEWILVQRTDVSGVSVMVLAGLDVAATKQVPVLEHTVERLRQKLHGLMTENRKWQLAFELLRGVFDSVSWEYEIANEQFQFVTPASKMLFGRNEGTIQLQDLEAHIHPADVRLFMSLLAKAPETTALAQGWMRVRNQDDSFDAWHYSLSASDRPGFWKGIWYRPMEAEVNLSLEHFLGFSRFLDDIGWGTLVLDKQLRLEHASTLAIAWLQLPEGWNLSPFESLEVVKNTRLAAEVCGYREAGSLYQFEYYNAYAQKWLFVWIYTTQNIRAVYMQLMK